MTGFVTTNEAVAVCDKVPLVPVITSEYVPTGVVLAVETDSVEVPPVAIEAGLKLAEAPAGNPLKASDSIPVKPFTAAVETV